MDVSLEEYNGPPSMDQILGVLETVPQSLIFIPGRRMTILGFIWAPLSFLSQRPSRIGGSQEYREEDAMSSTLTNHGVRVFKPSISFEHGFSVSEKFVDFAKLAIRTGLRAGYGIRASVDLDSSSNQFSPRYLRSAAVTFERGGNAMHGVLVGNFSEQEGKMYCYYEVAVTLSWPLSLSDHDTAESLEGSYADPKTWCID